MAARQKSDQSRDDLCAVGFRKRASVLLTALNEFAQVDDSEVFLFLSASRIINAGKRPMSRQMPPTTRPRTSDTMANTNAANKSGSERRKKSIGLTSGAKAATNAHAPPIEAGVSARPFFFFVSGHPWHGRQGRRGGWRRQAAVFTHQLPIVRSFAPIVIPWSNAACKDVFAKFLFIELAEFRTAASNVENCSLRLVWCRGNRLF
jgi:hypothetical protein